MAANNHTPIHDMVQKHQASSSKEAEPLGSAEVPSFQEVVEHHEVAPDVAPYVKVTKETIKLPTDLKDAGVESVSHPKFTTHQSVHIPLTDEKIEEGLHKPVTSSFRWLAELCLYMLRKAHIALKVVHGKVVRKRY